MEHPAHGAGGGDAPTILCEQAPDFSRGTIPVVRAQLDHYGHSVRSVHLVAEILEASRLPAAGSLLDGALDVVVGHAGGAALEQRQPQPRVQSGVASADLCRNGDLLGKFRENLPTLG